MRRYAGVLSLIVPLALFSVASPIQATFGVDEFRIRMWMLPPMDVNGNNACLTQAWHGPSMMGDDQTHALDWKAHCGSNGDSSSKPAHMRFVAAAPDDTPVGTIVNRAMAEPLQVTPNPPCGVGTVRVTRVRIRATWDDLVKGKASYGHTLVRHTTPWQIQFKNGASLSNAYYMMSEVGDTRSDAAAGSSCWQGWHTHENNSNDPAWDNWHGIYTGAGQCECYVNTDPDNWMRRIQWIE